MTATRSPGRSSSRKRSAARRINSISWLALPEVSSNKTRLNGASVAEKLLIAWRTPSSYMVKSEAFNTPEMRLPSRSVTIASTVTRSVLSRIVPISGCLSCLCLSCASCALSCGTKAVSARHRATEPQSRRDKGTRRQGDKEKGRRRETFPCPLVPLSPCPLVFLSLPLCGSAALWQNLDLKNSISDLLTAKARVISIILSKPRGNEEDEERKRLDGYD